MDQETWSKLEIVLVSAAILLIAFSLILPEFKVNTHYEPLGGATRTTERSFYFDKVENRVTSIGGTSTSYETYDSTFPTDYTAVGHALSNERLWLACWVFLCWMLVVALVFGREVVQILVGWMTVMAALVALVYPIVEISSSIPGTTGFMGSSSSSDVTMSWGPASAWYLAVIAATIVVAVVVRRMSRFFTEPKEEAEEPDVNLPQEALTDEPTK